MEYSKDIVLGVKFFNGEDKHENLKLEEIRENKYDKVKKIVKKISKATINKEKICKLFYGYFISRKLIWKSLFLIRGFSWFEEDAISWQNNFSYIQYLRYLQDCEGFFDGVMEQFSKIK